MKLLGGFWVNQEAFFGMVLHALERCGIPYMVAGSVAAMLYGEPRLTNDMDVVVEMATRRAQRVAGSEAQGGRCPLRHR
jgi:hypothetical protein